MALHSTPTYTKKLLKAKNWKEPTYQEIHCLIGLLMSTSIVKMSNNRNCFTDSLKCGKSNIFESVKHRFQQHHTILNFENNDLIPHTLKTAQRFEAILANLRIRNISLFVMI